MWREDTSWCENIHLGERPVGSNLTGFCPQKSPMEVPVPEPDCVRGWCEPLSNAQTPSRCTARRQRPVST